MFLDCIGSIAYWQKIVKSNIQQVATKHTFQKQCSLSQYAIISDKGLNQLSIPTVRSTRRGQYSSVEISNTEQWQRNHWRAIKNAYQKAPFFIYYDYKIEPLFSQEFNYLVDFNKSANSIITDILKLTSISIDDKQEVYYEEVSGEKLDSYPQVFDNKLGFIKNASILDLILNLGPKAQDYLAS